MFATVCALHPILPLAAETVELNVAVQLDGTSLGEVPIRIDEAESRITAVSRRIFDLVAPIARLPLSQAEVEWWSIDELAAEGFFLDFDLVRLVLVLELKADLRTLQTHRLGRAYSIKDVTATPETYSGGVNLYARSVYEREDDGNSAAPGLDFVTRLGPFLNVRDWVVEGEVRYDTAEAKPLEVTEYRLVRDLRSWRMRFEAGTLSYPTIAAQGRRDIVGLGLSRRFELDPDQDSRRTTAEFFLDRGDQVKVYLNDQEVYSEYLPPGPHLLDGLTLSPGRNELRVEAGGETQLLIIPHEAELLKAGLTDLAVAAGGLQDEMDSLAGGGFYRRGITDAWSAGAYTHLDSGAQMAGLESTNAFTFGSFQTTLAASRAALEWEDGAPRWGWVGALTYRLTLSRSLLSSVLVAFNARSRYFSPAGALAYGNLYIGDALASFGLRLGETSYASLGLRGALAYEEGDHDITLSVSGRTRLGKSWQLFTGLRLPLLGKENEMVQGTVTLTYYPARLPNIRGSATQTIGETATTLAVSGDGKRPGSGLRWDASTTLSSEDERPYQADGSVRYGGNRGELQLAAAGETGSSELESNFRLEGGGESALLFAGKTVAIGRPVRDGFILVRKHESMDGAIVGVRNGETWRERTDRLGPAAIGGYSAYRYQRLELEADGVPADVDAGNLSHLVFPGYRSGYTITVGTGVAVYAGGTLTDADGEPLALVSLEARNADGTETIRFFTDEGGIFEVYGLKPGSWEFTLPKDGRRARLEIPEDAAGYLDLGSMRMEKP